MRMTYVGGKKRRRKGYSRRSRMKGRVNRWKRKSRSRMGMGKAGE